MIDRLGLLCHKRPSSLPRFFEEALLHIHHLPRATKALSWRRRWPRMAPVLMSTALALVGCIRALPGEEPPEGARLYYPARMALSADGSTAFVVNLNFDQRFNTSWLTQVDVPQLVALAEKGQSVLPALQQGLHVPGLGGDLVFDAQSKRAYLAHRGAGLLTVLDVVAAPQGATTLSCGVPDGSGAEGLGHYEAHTDCDRAHLMRLKEAVVNVDGKNTDPNKRQYDDPYALAVLPQADGSTAVAVGYLGAGRITVLHDDGVGLPQVAGYIKTPARGVARLLVRDDGLLFAASKSHMGRSLDADLTKSYLMGIDLRDPNTGLTSVLGAQSKGGLLAQSYALSTALGGLSRTQPSGISGLVASPNDRSQLLVVSQQPDAVTLVDVSRPPQTSSQEDGTQVVTYPDLGFALLGAESVAQSTLSDVVYVPRQTSDLVVVTSLSQDALYFFDPSYSDLQLVHRITLGAGQGPVGLLPVQVNGKEYLLVSTFFDHGLSVIDISATNYTDFKILTSFHDESFAVAPRVR